MLSRIPSRSSFASQASTVTLKSTSGGMRRNRIRSSVTSTRSSASDRTITNEFLNLSDDLSPDGGAGVGARDNERVEYSTSRPEDQGRNPTRHKTFNRHEQNFVLNATTDNNRRDQNTALNTVRNATTDNGKAAAMLDPTYVAQKVLAETRPQRQALEFMQKWSVDKLQQKRMESAENDHRSDDTPSQSHECHPSIRGQSLHELTDSASDLSLHGGSSCAVSQPSKSVGQSAETKISCSSDVIKSEVTYANIPFSKHPGNNLPVSGFVQPDRRSINQVGSGEVDMAGQNTVSGQNAAFRRSTVATPVDKLQSCGSTPWRNTTSTTAGKQTAVKRLFGYNRTIVTGNGKSADSNLNQASPVAGLKPFVEGSSANVAPSSAAPQTKAEELRLSDDWNDSAVNRNTMKQMRSPDGQTQPGNNNNSSVASAMKSVRRPSKPKTVKFQDEIETMSLSSDEPSPKAESCVVKNTGSGSVGNVVKDNGAQLGDRSVEEIGNAPEDSPVMYKNPPPYPGPGRKPPSSYRAAQSGTVEGDCPSGNATPVSNGYREQSLEPFHDQYRKYNDHVSVWNGHNDQSWTPVRRGGSTDSSTTPVDDEMGDLNSRQNLKRMSMHMYTSSDDSTTSAGHRPNVVAHKRVTENFQRFQQARTCNGDATPNTNTNFATSTPSFNSVQNGAPKFIANHTDRRRECDWESRTCVPGSHGENTFNRSRHIQDPSTLPSSQC